MECANSGPDAWASPAATVPFINRCERCGHRGCWPDGCDTCQVLATIDQLSGIYKVSTAQTVPRRNLCSHPDRKLLHWLDAGEVCEFVLPPEPGLRLVVP